MIKKPIFAQKDLMEFAMKHIRETLPETTFEQGEDELSFRFVERDGKSSGWLNLHNIWNQYQKECDLNAVIEFINSQYLIAKYIQQHSDQPKGVDLFNIYPAIRQKNYINSLKDQSRTANWLSNQTVPGLDTIFVEQNKGFLVSLNETIIKPVLVYMNVEEIKNQAYDNLRKKGWVSSQVQMPALNFAEKGQLHAYESVGYPFLHQFFLPDMYAGHLPDSFLVAFPDQNMAVVSTIQGSIRSASQAKQIADRSGMRYFVRQAYTHELRPLSCNIYWVQGSKRYLL